jgi:hypothetical protein
MESTATSGVFMPRFSFWMHKPKKWIGRFDDNIDGRLRTCPFN